MLGRLEMDVNSCIKAYCELSKQIFQKKLSTWRIISRLRAMINMKERFDSKELEKAIKQIIRNEGGNKDTMLFDEANPAPKCKV